MRSVSRRVFIKNTVVLATACALFSVLPGVSVWADNSETDVAHTLTDGTNVFTITATDFTYSGVTSLYATATPTFQIKSEIASGNNGPLFFRRNLKGVEDGSYVIVTDAVYDNNESAQELACAGYGADPLGVDPYDMDFMYDGIAANTTEEGEFTYQAADNNWKTMVVNMTLYKKVDGQAIECGSTAFTFTK